MRDVLGQVKRSFATVRGALTEQRAQSTDLARQVAAGMTKVDRLAVALEQSTAAHMADRQTMANIAKRLDEVLEKVTANDDADDNESAPVDDPHAWVAPLRVRFSGFACLGALFFGNVCRACTLAVRGACTWVVISLGIQPVKPYFRGPSGFSLTMPDVAVHHHRT